MKVPKGDVMLAAYSPSDSVSGGDVSTIGANFNANAANDFLASMPPSKDMAGKFDVLPGQGAQPMFSYDANGYRSLVPNTFANAATGQVIQDGKVNTDLTFGNSSIYSQALASTVTPYGMSLMSSLPPAEAGGSVHMLAAVPGATGSVGEGAIGANVATNAQRAAFMDQAAESERARVAAYVAQQNSVQADAARVQVAYAGNNTSSSNSYYGKTESGSVESYSAMPAARVGESGVGSTSYVAANGGTYAALAAPVEVKESAGGAPELTNVASLDQFPKAERLEHAKLSADPARVAAISSIPMVAKATPAPAAHVQQVKQAPAQAYAKASFNAGESHSVASLSKPAPVHTAQHKPAPSLAKPVAHVNAMPLPPAFEAHTAVAQAEGYMQQTPVHKQHARTVQDVASMNPMPLPPRAHNAELIAHPMPTNVEQVALAKPSAPAHPIELNMMPASTRAAEHATSIEPGRVVNKLRDVAVFASHARDAKAADEAPITSWLPGNNNQGLELARAAAPQMPEGVDADGHVDDVSKHFENTIANLTSSGASYDVVQSVVDNYRDYLRYKNNQSREQQQAAAAPQAWHSMNV